MTVLLERRRLAPGELRLLSTNAVDRLGAGLLLTSSTVYFTHVVGLPPTTVGIVLAVAGVVSMAAATPIGMLADRFGTRRTLVMLYIVRGLATLGYLLVGNWWQLLAMVTLRVTTDQPMAPLTQALVAQLVENDQRIRLMARMRVVSNVCVALSGPFAGLAEVMAPWPLAPRWRADSGTRILP